MSRYKVYGTYDVEWVVEADSADEAQQAIDDGEAGNGEIVGASIDNIVTDGKPYDAPDERRKCMCGHILSEHGDARYWDYKTSGWKPKACHRYGCHCQAAIEAEEVGSDG